MDYIVAGTGSRSLQTGTINQKVKVLRSLHAEIEVLKDRHGGDLVIMSGMAKGFDKALAVSCFVL